MWQNNKVIFQTGPRIDRQIPSQMLCHLMLEAQDILSYLTPQQSQKECTAELFLSEPTHQKQMVKCVA